MSCKELTQWLSLAARVLRDEVEQGERLMKSLNKKRDKRAPTPVVPDADGAPRTDIVWREIDGELVPVTFAELAAELDDLVADADDLKTARAAPSFPVPNPSP